MLFSLSPKDLHTTLRPNIPLPNKQLDPTSLEPNHSNLIRHPFVSLRNTQLFLSQHTLTYSYA